MRVFLAAAVLAAAASGARAQTAAPTRTPEPQPVPATSTNADAPHAATAAVSVGYVLVPFVITDMKGRPVRDLKRKNVTLLSDGQAVETDLFERSDDAPVSFAILLDASGSMALSRKMEGARAAIRALIARRIKGDEFALFVFSEGQVRDVVPFTDDVARVTRAVDAAVPFGKTALFDAIAKMPDRTLLGKNGSRAILLLTDGIDNASTLSVDQLTKLLEGIEIPVYPLGLRATDAVGAETSSLKAESLLNLDVLGHIARMSGGRLEIVTEPAQLDAALREIERDLRSQYLLGFTPTGSGAVTYRRLSLRISGRPRPVRVRAGYRGTDPPYVGRSKS